METETDGAGEIMILPPIILSEPAMACVPRSTLDASRFLILSILLIPSSLFRLLRGQNETPLQERNLFLRNEPKSKK